MARKPRLCIPNTVHFVTTEIINTRILLRDQNDKEKFLQYLNDFLSSTGFELLGINFYLNHYQMVLRINALPLKALFRGFHSSYARYYNKRHGLNGYLFQGRPKSVPVEDGPYAQQIIAFLHTGPIRAGLCKTIEDLDKFKDGTHSAVMGNSHFPNLKTKEILKLYSSDSPIDPKTVYRKTIRQMIESGDIYREFREMLNASIKDKQNMFKLEYWVIGSQKFKKDALELDKERRIRMANYKRIGYDHDKLAEFIFSRMAVPLEEIKTRGRMNALSDARKLYCYFAVTVLEMTTLSTAAILNITSTAVCRMAKLGKKIAKKKGMVLPVC